MWLYGCHLAQHVLLAHSQLMISAVLQVQPRPGRSGREWVAQVRLSVAWNRAPSRVTSLM
jgi:hypothetical protein